MFQHSQLAVHFKSNLAWRLYESMRQIKSTLTIHLIFTNCSIKNTIFHSAD